MEGVLGLKNRAVENAAVVFADMLIEPGYLDNRPRYLFWSKVFWPKLFRYEVNLSSIVVMAKGILSKLFCDGALWSDHHLCASHII